MKFIKRDINQILLNYKKYKKVVCMNYENYWENMDNFDFPQVVRLDL